MMTIIITLLARSLRIHTKWVISFLSLFSATSGGILDRAIEAEDQKHGDLLRLVILSWLVLPLPHVLLLQKMFCCIHSGERKRDLTLCLHYLWAGPCWRLPGIVCQDKGIFFYCCCFVGCRFLHQSWWWRPRKYWWVNFFFSSTMRTTLLAYYIIHKNLNCLICIFSYSRGLQSLVQVKALDLSLMFIIWRIFMSY